MPVSLFYTLKDASALCIGTDGCFLKLHLARLNEAVFSPSLSFQLFKSEPVFLLCF